MYIFWVNLITFPQAPNSCLEAIWKPAFVVTRDATTLHPDRTIYRFGAMSCKWTKWKMRQKRLSSRHWGDNCTYSFRRCTWTKAWKRSMTPWYPIHVEQSRFPWVSAVAPDPNFEGVMKKFYQPKKNTETDLLFFSEKIHRPKIFEITISCYMCLVYPISWI